MIFTLSGCPVSAARPFKFIGESFPVATVELNGDSFALPSRYISSASITQMQPDKRSHMTASALILFINITQPH